MTLRIILTTIAYFLLAAHFSRHNLDAIAIIVLAFPLFFFIRRKWALKVLEYGLYLGAISWIIPSIHIVQDRIVNDQPYLRFVIIISVIVIYTIFSALYLRSYKSKQP